MAFLVRKISPSKWDVDVEGPINADAITNCLRTSGNTLSFWKVESEVEIADAVLALAASNDNLDKMDVVVVPESAFTANNISIQSTPGRTACVDLAETHRDLSNLTFHHLGIVADLLAEKIRNGQTTRFTMGKLRTILVAAIDDGRLDFEKLSEGIQKKLRPKPAPEPCPTCGVSAA